MCLSGAPGVCDNVSISRAQGVLPNGNIKLSRNGKPIYHYSGISCFAEYAVTPSSSLVKIASDIPLDIAALFGCAVVAGVGAVLNTAQVKPGDRVAVFGLGGVGLNAIMGARLAGATTIIGVDLAPSKFDLAKQLGATHTIAADDPGLLEEIRDLAPGGLEYAFEVSGAEAALHSAFAALGKRGEVICVGLRASSDMYRFPPVELVTSEKAIRGSLMGSRVPAIEIPRYMDFYRQGLLPVDRLETGSVSFDELNLGFDRLHSGEVLRQILRPSPTDRKNQ
jgi:Zn-dependent alcohol dehydrogenase